MLRGALSLSITAYALRWRMISKSDPGFVASHAGASSSFVSPLLIAAIHFSPNAIATPPSIVGRKDTCEEGVLDGTPGSAKNTVAGSPRASYHRAACGELCQT